LAGQPIQVQSVQLKLFAQAPASQSNVTLTPSVFAITAPDGNWVQGGGGPFGSPAPGLTTWNQQQSGTPGIPWVGSAGLSTPGVDYTGPNSLADNATPWASVSLASGVAGVGAGYAANQEIDFNFSNSNPAALTALIQGWAADNVAGFNPGLLILDPNETAFTQTLELERITFNTTASGNPALDPQLVVNYTVVSTPEPAAFGMLLIGLCGLLWVRRKR
jgi:hypothetical protein